MVGFGFGGVAGVVAGLMALAIAGVMVWIAILMIGTLLSTERSSS
jgi:hypothetical protein